ncbi:NADH-quinone oxidoreductase subunit NuoH [Desulfurobacterium atlanticum]|uniref:NADH-quinone oxidoreductase subunit H n=1 Tax=Desulfurobacterium atlanticum TaxID=240169 RepID=A0A238YYT8_9BACT|nr:NADH-quinone oxidoreductase subunit NuoH [Desulfurobacterium atlanticum]SNR75911.1 NADH dehydrogenase subunit H [Desulfurobacterium atlanticum]
MSGTEGTLIKIVVGLLLILGFIGFNAILLGYGERKISGFIQRRLGPYAVGPHGSLQMMVDMVKLMTKQLITPKKADKYLFWAAPLIAFMSVPVLFMVIPFSPTFTVINSNLGIVLILAFSGLNVLALCIGGWGSNNKWSLLGAARAVSQFIAFEVPILLVVLSIALMTGTLNLSEIVNQQGGFPWQWNIVLQPLAFVILFVASLAEMNRVPFDLPEGESELTAGYNTEYGGMGFGLFVLAEYTHIVVASSVMTALFLGGWKGPVFSGVWWFLLKMYLLCFIILWIRWAFPRVRFDQLLNLSWKYLIPAGIVNLLITALFVKLF